MSAGQGKGRLDDAEFRRLVDEAKERHNISDIVRRRTKVVRADRELVALCLFHKERTPSMRLNDAKGIYHCFGCGASGDIVKLVRETEGLGFMEAMRWLGAAGLPAVDAAARVQAAEEDARDRQRAIDRARDVWGSAMPAAGTASQPPASSG
jgi:DNA primase